MLFESFTKGIYSNGDIKDMLQAKDGRTWKTDKVFIEALKCMKRHIFKTFKEKDVRVKDTKSGQLRPIGGIEDVQWILTVPAIWNDRAKAKMERWSQYAGLIDKRILDHLRIVYEPDCASISCQYEAADEEREMANGAPSAFSVGTRYILIDAGGGMNCALCPLSCSDLNPGSRCIIGYGFRNGGYRMLSGPGGNGNGRTTASNGRTLGKR